MNRNLMLRFSGSVNIELQGEKVLNLEALFPDHVEYLLDGFKKPTVKIHDYRKEGVKAIARYLYDEDRQYFTKTFCSTSKIKMYSDDANEDFFLEFSDTKVSSPKHVLWMAAGTAGILKSIPIYSYLVFAMVELQRNRRGLFSLYERKKVDMLTAPLNAPSM